MHMCTCTVYVYNVRVCFHRWSEHSEHTGKHEKEATKIPMGLKTCSSYRAVALNDGINWAISFYHI